MSNYFCPGPLSKLGNVASAAAAIGAAASPLAALTALTAGPSIYLDQPIPALSVQFPGYSYNDYYSNAYALPTEDHVSLPDINIVRSVGSGIGAAAGAAASAGLRTLSNVATTLSNAAGTAENLQRQFVKRLQETPVVRLVQNTFSPAAAPAEVPYK